MYMGIRDELNALHDRIAGMLSDMPTTGVVAERTRERAAEVVREAANTVQERFREAEVRLKYMVDEIIHAVGHAELSVILNAAKGLIAALLKGLLDG